MIKLMNIMFMILTMMMMTSLNNWISYWLIIELINFLFTFNLMKKPNTAIKFYVSQSIMSMIMVMILIKANSMSFNNLNNSNSLFLITLIKMNIYPMNLWMVNMNKNISWLNFFFINLLFKIPPLIILKNINLTNNYMIMIMLISMILLNMMMKNLKMIMMFITSNNMYWFILSINVNLNKWLMIMLIYFIINMKMIMLMKFLKMNFINQLLINNKNNSMVLVLMLINLVGIPPMIMFLMKWILMKMIMLNSNILSMILMMNLLNQYYYLKMMINLIMMFFSTKNWMKKNYFNKSKNNYMNKISILMMILI